MAEAPGPADYSIAAVSKLTGASCHALRVWERRYGFPVPRRTAAGHRRYSGEQVRAIQVIAELARQGAAIGELIAAHRAGRLVVPAAAASGLPGADEAIGRLLDRLAAGDLEASDAYYRSLIAGLSPVEVVTRVIGPSWIESGERWYRQQFAIYQEHVVSQFLLRKLEVMIEGARLSNDRPTRTVVVGTVQGDRHAGGILMLSIFLEGAGWRVINLGTDLPIRDFGLAVRQWHSDALALSFVLSRNIKRRFQELVKIHGLPIFVGGRSILNYQALARRHGLIPLPGPLAASAPQLLAEFEHWKEGHEGHLRF